MATHYLPSSSTWYSTSNKYIFYRFKIDESVSNGVRNVSVAFQMYKDSSSTAKTCGNGTITMIINGATYTKTVNNSTANDSLETESSEDGIVIANDGVVRTYYTLKPTIGASTTALTVKGSISIPVAEFSSESQGGSVTLTTAYYSVTYSGNGGTNVPDSQTKYHGTNLVLSDIEPVRDDYEFVGWGTSSTDITLDYHPSDIYTSNAALSLYAIWKRTITLSYDGNGTDIDVLNQTADLYNADTQYIFPVTYDIPERDGHIFLGWSKSADDTDASYVAGDSLILSEDETLYAIWKIITFTVSYDTNGGTGEFLPQTKIWGEDLTLHSSAPKMTGFLLDCWNTSIDGTGTSYQPSDVYTENADLVLYAIWKYANVGWKKVNGEWKKFNTYKKINGEWIPFIVYTKDDVELWQQGII